MRIFLLVFFVGMFCFTCKPRQDISEQNQVKSVAASEKGELDFTCENFPEQSQIIASVTKTAPYGSEKGCNVTITVEQSWPHAFCPYRFNSGSEPEEVLYTPNDCPVVKSQASGVIMRDTKGRVTLDGEFTLPDGAPKKDFSCENYPQQAQIIGRVSDITPQGPDACLVTVLVEKSWPHALCPYDFAGGSQPEETFYYPRPCPNVTDAVSGVIMKDQDGKVTLDGSVN